MTRLRLFGHPAIETPEATEPLRLPLKAVVMTALIAAHWERPLAREWLAQTLWPDLDPPQALGNLRRKLHEALEVLGRDALTISRQSVQWTRDGSLETDIVRFDLLQRSDPAAALDAYGGEICAGIDDEALDGIRRQYRFRYEQLLRTLLEDARRAGDRTALRKCLIRAVAFDPFDEQAVRELMSVEADEGNRAAALREYTAFCHRLRSEIGADPQPETVALFTAIAAQRALDQPLPIAATTSFVGRERDLERIESALRVCKVVTLIGSGGIGKTRLAAQCATQFGRAYAHGAWFVDLENARSEGDVWERIAQTCRIETSSEPRSAVLRFLSAREALLILDTCEHVPEAARHAAEALSSLQSVRVLTTSRKRLRIENSREIDVAPLEIPPSRLLAGDSALRYPAYRLFIERAALANPAFRVDAADLPAVHDLLYSIDGLPLAIELVASRTAVLGVRDLQSRLAQSLRSARSTRARRGETLQAALAWSYELLPPAARDLFTRISVFQAPFTVQDAEEVACEGARATELLLELSDASLISRVPIAGPPRYRLLETTRDFAYGLLLERDDFEEVVRAHAECFARKADVLITTPDADFALIIDDVLRSMPDFVLGMRQAAERAWGEMGRRFIEGLYRFGIRHHARAEIARCGLAFYHNDAIDPIARMRIARLTANVLENEEAAVLFEAAAAYYRAAGDSDRLADALNGLAATRFHQGRHDECERLLLEARDHLEGTRDRRLLLKTLVRLGTLYDNYERSSAALLPPAEELIALGELRQAAQVLKNVAAWAYHAERYEDTLSLSQRALDLTSRTSDLGIRINLHSMCACALMKLGDAAAAARAHLDANALIPSLGECLEVAETFQDAAMMMTAAGIFEESAYAIGYSERLRESLGSPMKPEERESFEATVQRLEEALGARYQAIRWSGARDTVESAEAVVSAALRRLCGEDSTIGPEVSPRRNSSSERAE